MSLFAPDDFGYLQQVEAFFLSLSQVGVFVSSRDTEMARKWRDAGTPVEVLCRGIQMAFEQEQPPRSVYDCRFQIDREIKAWRTRQAGAHAKADGGAARVSTLPGRDLPDPMAKVRRTAEPPVEPPTTGRQPTGTWELSMARLIELGSEASAEAKPHYRWAYGQMKALSRELGQADDRDAMQASVPLAIGEIEGAMFDRAFATMSDEARAALDGGMPERIKRAMQTMSSSARARQLRLWRRRSLESSVPLGPFFVP